MKAQLKVTKIVTNGSTQVVHLDADNSNPGNPKNDVNNTYSTGTPKASLDITVESQSEQNFFVQDKIYAVTITPA